MPAGHCSASRSRGNGLNLEKARAFGEGYARFAPASRLDIADALRITWCMESPWWFQPAYFREDHGKATRFRDEILWIPRHWFELDGLCAVLPAGKNS